MLRLSYGRACSRVVAALMSVFVVIGQCLPAGAQSADSPLPENLNLGSIRRTATAPDSLTSPVTIVNGGRGREVTAGMALTPAQAVAVAQILQTGVQSIVLGTRGRAVGGSVDLSGMQNITSLMVPRGVSVVRDFGAAAPLELAGNLVNSGVIQAVATPATMAQPARIRSAGEPEELPPVSAVQVVPAVPWRAPGMEAQAAQSQ